MNLVYRILLCAACLGSFSSLGQTPESPSSPKSTEDLTTWVEPGDYLIDEAEKKWWWRFAGPAKSNPADQLAHAESLVAKGKEKKAITHFGRLANFWPASEQAPVALQRKAELLVERGELQSGFNTYQQLMEKYSGPFSFAEVLEKQYAVAETVRTKVRGDFFLLPGYTDPLRAVPLYEAIVTNAPQWVRSPEVLYLTGRIHEDEQEYREAVVQYGKVVAKYPDSDFARKAAQASALCYNAIARKNPNDDKAAENAWAAMQVYLNRYPGADGNDEILTLMERMRSRLARSYYNKALYYDTLEKKPRSALVAYQALLDEFPTSEWTAIANTRINELEQSLGISVDN